MRTPKLCRVFFYMERGQTTDDAIKQPSEVRMVLHLLFDSRYGEHQFRHETVVS